MKANNWSTVIFPEGTRSKDGKLKPFAIGGVATILKKAPNALIVPIVIRNSWKLVQYGSFPLSFGERMSWEVLEPLEPEGRSMEEIMNYAEESIKKAL
jgi:1-acyl-sn-glycerol-3-phosphate acyltransferase